MATKSRANNEGSIYQRTDGRWCAEVSDGYGLDGKRKRRVVYGRTRAEVAAKLRSMQTDQSAGRLVTSKRQTLRTFLEAWLEDSVKQSRRPKTYMSYRQIIDQHLVPALGRYYLDKLTAQHVLAYINLKVESGLSNRTVAYHHATLRVALKDAMRWDLVSRNVAASVTPPRVKRHKVNPLSPAEAAKLLAAVHGTRQEALFGVALAVGLRLGEALGMRWEDVDLTEGTLTVNYQLQKINKEWVLVEPKSEQSRRVISLPDVCVKSLKAHRTRQLQDQLAAETWGNEFGLVFTTSIGTPVDDANVRRELNKAVKAANLRTASDEPRHVRFHDLRHTCASLLLAQNVHPRVVMEVLGHSQISLTMDTYSHVMPALTRDAANLMNDLLSRSMAGN